MNSAAVDLKAKAVTVTMKKGQLDRKDVEKALAGTKFEVNSFEQPKDVREMNKTSKKRK